MDLHHEIWELCKDAAENIYDTRKPSPKYAHATACLLFGTALHESDNLRARRQYKFGWDSDNGGWGLWQVERGSMLDSIRSLRSRDMLGVHAARWLFQTERVPTDWHMWFTTGQLCRLMAGWNRFAVLMARCHYLRRPEPIPYTLDEQAAYWKRYYNTVLGAGDPEDYIRHWQAWGAPIVKGAA